MRLELQEIYGDEHTRVDLATTRSGRVAMRSALYDADVEVELTPAEARVLAAELTKCADRVEARHV